MPAEHTGLDRARHSRGEGGVGAEEGCNAGSPERIVACVSASRSSAVVSGAGLLVHEVVSQYMREETPWRA